MPLRTDTYDLDAEADRLETRLDELADEIVQLADDDPRKQELVAEGQQLDAQLEGVRWAQTAHTDDAVPAWDRDAETVTLGGLTGGEFGRVEDTVTDDDVGAGGTRVYLVEAGTVEAPYLDDGMAEPDRIAAVASLPLPYLKWAEAQVNALTGVSDEGNDEPRFGDMLAAKRATTSTDE